MNYQCGDVRGRFWYKNQCKYNHQSRRTPCHPAGEARKPHLRVDFDRRLKLEFHGSKVTSDAGFLAYRELDGALGLTEVAWGHFQDSRTGKNGRHGMVGQFRQSVFGRLGGYDIKDNRYSDCRILHMSSGQCYHCKN